MTDTLTPTARHREAWRLRPRGWRYITAGMGLIRQADALADELVGQDSYELIKCAQCGNVFPLFESEKAWLAEKRDTETGAPLQPPKRCADCRALRARERKRQQQREEKASV